MAIKLYGSPVSTCTLRVLTTLIEKGIPYQLVPIALHKGEQKSAEHIAKQPFGRIPVLDDDGFLIYESRAICRYIAKKYAAEGTKLIPDDGDFKGYGLFEQACSLELSYFNGPAEGIANEKVFQIMRGKSTDEAQVAKYAKELDETLKVYDGILVKQSYLAGDEVTLADLFHLSYGKMCKTLGFADLFEGKYGNVKRWFDALEARESWVKANA